MSPRDWRPAFLLLVQGDFHLPSSNSKIKKGTICSFSFNPLVITVLCSHGLVLIHPPHCPQYIAWSVRYHVPIFLAVCFVLSCFLCSLIHWHMYLPRPGALLYITLLCQCPLENLQLVWGLRELLQSRSCAAGVVKDRSWLHFYASFTSVIIFLCEKRLNTLRHKKQGLYELHECICIYICMNICVNSYQINLTLRCCLLAKDSLQKRHVLMIPLLRRQSI